MTAEKHLAVPAENVTRRQAIAGLAIACGSLAIGSRAWSATGDATKETAGKGATGTRTSLHYEVDFTASPQRIYGVLLDSKQFTALTGRTATIDPREGGTFSMFGGVIVGRHIELVPDQRIVQAWRPTHWNPGIFSIVKFELQGKGSQTHLVLDHTGFPPAESDSLDSGWKAHYLEPLAKFLA